MNSKNIFIFVGPPGSGKGTLSQYCAKRLDWKQLSTGDLCRKHIKERTDIGKRIDFAIKSGNLIDDQLIVSMVRRWLNDNIQTVNAVILDGFPRTVAQAEALQHLLTEEFPNYRLHVVIFDIPDEIVIERLSARAVCSNMACQAVYSLLNNFLLAPKQEGICDVCKSLLVQRADDRSDAIHERLKVYHVHEKQILCFYRNSGLDLVYLKAYKSINKVFEDFITLFSINE